MFRSYAQEDHFNIGFDNNGDGDSGIVVHVHDVVGSHEGASVGSGKELSQPTLDRLFSTSIEK